MLKPWSAAIEAAHGEKRRTQVIGPPSYNPLLALRSAGEVREYVDLFLTLCRHRASVRYKQSVLGVAWALVQPLALMLVYFVIFSVVVQMPSDGIPYPVFVFAGLLPWTYFSSAVTSATMSLVSHNQMVSKVYFPREILPLSYVVVGILDFSIASSLLALLMAYYRIGVGLVAFNALLVLLVETVLVVALSMLFSAIEVQFRDLGLAMPLIMQVWMFASPVVYPLSKLPARFRTLYLLNPMVGILENFRRVVLQKEALDSHLLWISFLISAALLIASYSYFKLREATMADVI
jgi:homopolymeric O-antigen transport system permease protein